MRDAGTEAVSRRVEALPGIPRTLELVILVFEGREKLVEVLVVWSMDVVRELW